MAVNNAAAVFRPQLWCCGDDPGNFCDAIWFDPGILKFVPEENFGCRLTIRDDHDELVVSDATVEEMPGVFGYPRNEVFKADRWLCEETFNWGNDATITDDDGEVGGRSVMYVALRLLFYLGFRRVFLVGCDFRMKVRRRNYAFEQDRSPGSVDGNNRGYHALNVRLEALQPYFQRKHFVKCFSRGETFSARG